MYQVIETTKRDGSKAYRFVEGSGKRAVRFAVEQSRRFDRNPDVMVTRVFAASAAEVQALRAG